MAKLDRLERRKENKGSLSERRAGTLQTLKAQAEADALKAPVSQALVDKEADAAATMGGQVAQAGATELVQGLMGGGGPIRAGRAGQAIRRLGQGVAEAGAQARLGARELLEKVRAGELERAENRILEGAKWREQKRLEKTQIGADLTGKALTAYGNIKSSGG